MKRIFLCCLLLIMIVGCSDVQETFQQETGQEVASTESLDDSFYPIINLDLNSQRTRDYMRFYRTNDYLNIGRELQLLSTEHFSTSDHYMAEGQYLDDDIQYSFRVTPDQSENSLQPKKSKSFGGVKNVTMVRSVVEQDYYVRNGDKYELAGAAFAIVIDPWDKNNDPLTTRLPDSVVRKYGETCIKKLYNILINYESGNELVFEKVPLNICVYYAANKDVTAVYAGKFVSSCYCDGSLGKIEKLDHQNVVFTSSEAQELDLTTHSEFEVFKSKLKNGAIEAVGVIGYGKYKDKILQSLQIEIHANVKTYGELQYLVALAADDLNSDRFSANVDISVKVFTQDGFAAVILKSRNGDAISTIFE